MTCAAMFAQITSSDSVAAVPEPGSLILLSTVAAGVGFAAWRHSRNKYFPALLLLVIRGWRVLIPTSCREFVYSQFRC